MPGTEHFRNVLRHEVITSERVLTVRVDESLYFANTRYLEDRIYEALIVGVKVRCEGVERGRHRRDAQPLQSLAGNAAVP